MLISTGVIIDAVVVVAAGVVGAVVVVAAGVVIVSHGEIYYLKIFLFNIFLFFLSIVYNRAPPSIGSSPSFFNISLSNPI